MKEPVQTSGWYKSSYSNNWDGCVEVTTAKAAEGVIPTRDSKLADSPVVDLSTSGFTALVDHARNAQL